MSSEEEEVETCLWNFRPTALASGANYKNLRRKQLFTYYLEDCEKAQKNITKSKKTTTGSSIRKRKNNWKQHNGRKTKIEEHGNTSTTPCTTTTTLRTCQWNIHFLNAPWLSNSNNVMEHAKNIAQAIIDTDSDVIILNEFGRSPTDRGLVQLCSSLEARGYVIHVADCSYPTAIASRCPILQYGKVPLDYKRAAVHIQIDCTTKRVGTWMENMASGSSVIPTSSSKLVTIVGTHLEDCDAENGSLRLNEARTLIDTIDFVGAEMKKNNKNAVMSKRGSSSLVISISKENVITKIRNGNKSV